MSLVLGEGLLWGQHLNNTDSGLQLLTNLRVWVLVYVYEGDISCVLHIGYKNERHENLLPEWHCALHASA